MAEQGRVDGVELLLAPGAKIDARDRWAGRRRTALDRRSVNTKSRTSNPKSPRDNQRSHILGGPVAAAFALTTEAETLIQS